MNNHYTFRGTALCLLSTLLMLFVSNFSNANTNFDGNQDSNFFNAANWSNGLPGPGNDGTIVGGATADINSALIVNYVLTSFGTINVKAAVTVNGTLNNYTGSVCNILAGGSITNKGTMDQRGAMNIATGGAFSNASTGQYSSTGSASITNNGTLEIQGTFANLGMVTNQSTANFLGGNFTNNGTLDNKATFNLNGGKLTSVNGASIINNNAATWNHNANSILDNQGTLTNFGTYINKGSLTSNGTILNNGLFNNNSGGSIENFFRLNNAGTFNNNNQGTILNKFEINNSGVFTNNYFIDNGAALNNKSGGAFSNAANGEINNQFGSSITNENLFSNIGKITSVGDIVNASGIFTNGGTITTNTGGGIINYGSFNNNNLLNNLEEITNYGIFTNNGQLQNDSGGVFTNEGDLYNNQPARIANQFDLINNQNLYNFGTIENGVRIFNNDLFQNNGYLINIGDFVNGVTGVFENTNFSTTTGSNGGVLENANGGVFLNEGVINNNNEIFNLACSSFINKGIINNYYWWTNKSLFFNFGTFNELPYHQMDMDGGVEITGPTSSLLCESVSVSLGDNGTATITGTAISVTAYDDCSTLDLKVDGLVSKNFTCANLGSNPVSLSITDRKGNTVKCNATVTIVDDRAPVFQNCPANITKTATSTQTQVSWTPPTAIDNCGPVNVTSNKNPGDQFPTGVTTVTYNATDGKGNSAAPCTFTVTIVPPGDCADVASIRRVASTYDNCGNWCGGAYALTFGPGDCWTAGNDLLFIEYTNGTAQLVGSVKKGYKTGYLEINFSGRTTTAPSGSPKYELCVNSGASSWTYYTSFEGKATLEDCRSLNIKRYGPAFQMGMGGNLQDPGKLGASGWFSTNGGSSHGGDFNFRLEESYVCSNSIYLEAECADAIGSRWQVKTNAGASGGKLLLPPATYSYDTPPASAADIVGFNVSVSAPGYYRLFARTIVPNGNGDSYWVRVNNGNWVKWNTVNAPDYNGFQWDQVGDWGNCDDDLPVSFYLNSGANTIQFSWREPNACLDKLYLTFSGKKPTGMGGNATNCGTTNPPPPTDPFDGKILCIKSRHSGKSADIYGGSTSNGTGLIQWDAHGGDNQRFQFKSVGQGKYSITAMHSGKCLDAKNNGMTNGTEVIQMPWDGGNSQQWKVEDAGNGYYFIKNVINGLYLDVDGWSTSNGTKIHCWSWHGGNNQQWLLDECDNNAPTPCNKTCLFVVGSTNLCNSDAAVKNRLQSLGYTVILKDDGSCSTNDANDKGLILISSTVQSDYIGSKYRNVNVPVILWESYLMDDMKMTGTTANSHYGSSSYVSKIRLTSSSHPISDGMSGDYSVFTSGKNATWGNPGSGAVKIGYVPGNSNCSMIYAYDTGAGMVGMTAPAKRVGFFLHDDNADNLTSNGWKLFDRCVQWASSCDLGVRASSDDILELEAVRTNREVNLVWANNTAFRNDFFFVEKSTDGINFEIINEMNAYREEDTSNNVFEDTDTEPAVGLNYYRITVQFLDGSTRQSDIKVVEMVDMADFAVYPNPATTYTNINLEDIIGERDVLINVSDGFGRSVHKVVLDEVIDADYRLDLNEYKGGTYNVTILRRDKHPVTQKLIISK
ncbi:MAG: RICIN domain-containing protein [Saprospiraceae bacterium]